MTKKYILKPGKHQFTPGSPPVHENDGLSDDEAEWYIQHYPHIAALFEEIPGEKMPEVNEIIPRDQSSEGNDFPIDNSIIQ
jgi:hypothetical protein